MLRDEELREIRERADGLQYKFQPFMPALAGTVVPDEWNNAMTTNRVFAVICDVPRLLDEIDRLRSLVRPVKAHDCNRDHPGQDIYHPQG